MRVCIVGAGAIGGLVAARLANAGRDVSVVARRDHLAAIRRDGLRLIEPDGSEIVADEIQASSTLADLGTHDVVVLALKAHQIAAVASDLESVCGADTCVVPMQNGVPWWFFQRFGGDHDPRVRTTGAGGIGCRHPDLPRLPAIGRAASDRRAPRTRDR